MVEDVADVVGVEEEVRRQPEEPDGDDVAAVAARGEQEPERVAPERQEVAEKSAPGGRRRGGHGASSWNSAGRAASLARSAERVSSSESDSTSRPAPASPSIGTPISPARNGASAEIDG